MLNTNTDSPWRLANIRSAIYSALAIAAFVADDAAEEGLRAALAQLAIGHYPGARDVLRRTSAKVDDHSLALATLDAWAAVDTGDRDAAEIASRSAATRAAHRLA